MVFAPKSSSAGTLNNGQWTGTLYIKGGGDPTFGSASFDHFAYGGGATMQHLVANLIRTRGSPSIQGRVIGDESYFDSLRGTPATGFRFSTDVEGSLSALVYNRGLINQGSSSSCTLACSPRSSACRPCARRASRSL